MADRHAVHPHHVLRAVLVDPFCRDVITAAGADPDEVGITLDRVWLDAADTIEVEEVESRGVDLATVLNALNPPYPPAADWGGRRLTDATRNLLVRVLADRAKDHRATVKGGHVLLALLSCRDPIVAGALRAHGLTARRVRPLVARWGRRVD